MRDPILCPKCGVSFVAAALLPSKGELPQAAPKAREEVDVEAEETPDVELVSLEDVEEPDTDDEAVAIEDVDLGEDTEEAPRARTIPSSSKRRRTATMSPACSTAARAARKTRKNPDRFSLDLQGGGTRFRPLSGGPSQGPSARCYGVIAQLGERLNGIQEVGGSNSAWLHHPVSDELTVRTTFLNSSDIPAACAIGSVQMRSLPRSFNTICRSFSLRHHVCITRDCFTPRSDFASRGKWSAGI